MSRVLFVAPHPDDETLGCAGSILKHVAAGDTVYWLIMTNVSKEGGYADTVVEQRQQEIERVAKEYFFTETIKLDLPTTRLDVVPTAEIIGAVSSVLQEIAPNVVYLPCRGDIHSDHKITFDVLMSATKSFRNFKLKKVLMYETISETEFAPPLQGMLFVPNLFSDITEYMDKKISIMKIYESELGLHPSLPRSVENMKALATFRGATCGRKYAEAFMILKEIC